MERGVTARRSSFITGVPVSCMYRVPKPDKDKALKDAIRSIWRPNMGYRMAHEFVKASFAPLNVKRTRRVWKELKLGRAKRYRKQRSGQSIPFRATFANEVWTMDFIFDSCLNGTKLKILSVVDEVTRECLALEVSTKLNAKSVEDVLAGIMKQRGAPKYVRSDNGGEFIARLVSLFLAKHKSNSFFVEPGKPWQNGFVESFHSTLRRDHLDVEVFYNLADAQIRTSLYRRYYNEVRPHSSTGKLPPSVAARRAALSLTHPQTQETLMLSS